MTPGAPVAEVRTAYSGFTDEALCREAEALERRIAVFERVDSPAGIRVHHELVKRFDEVRAELQRRASI